jgi:hypothetical protein
MKIVIPTYDRYDRFETLSFLKRNNIPINDIYIFLANEEEKNKYINSFGNEYNFIIGVIGLNNQRNFITNYFDDGEIIISMDDDIEELHHKNDMPLLDWLNESIDYLKNSNYALLSICPSVNPFFFEQRKNSESFKIGNYYAIGAFYILKNDKNILLNNDILLEDWERSLLYFKKYGANIRYNDILIKTKYFGKGGLQKTRTKNNYLMSVNKLLYHYPEYISFNYKKLPLLDKYIEFPNLKFKRQIDTKVDVIELPNVYPSELSILYEMLQNINIRKKGEKSNRRGFPLGHRSATFGYTRARYGTRKNGKLYDLSTYSLKYPEVYNELLRIGNLICPFEFNSIHVNENVICPPHKDSNNVGESLLISFGDYTGCNIIIEGNEYDTNCKPIIFDGSNLLHYNTNDLIGDKYSLVYFNNIG